MLILSKHLFYIIATAKYIVPIGLVFFIAIGMWHMLQFELIWLVLLELNLDIHICRNCTPTHSSNGFSIFVAIGLWHQVAIGSNVLPHFPLFMGCVRAVEWAPDAPHS
jgi:hypothetical protein